METQTFKEYYKEIEKCKDIFSKKTNDYGTAWRIMRPESITDQIFIKAKRIRSIQEKGLSRIEEGIGDEFLGIVNYCIMGMIQLELRDAPLELSPEEAESLYQKYAEETIELLKNKNHDYDEAWRDMRISSITDIILMKLFRVKQIEDNQGKTLISEGIKANYQDIMNYSVFCLIKLSAINN